MWLLLNMTCLIIHLTVDSCDWSSNYPSVFMPNKQYIGTYSLIVMLHTVHQLCQYHSSWSLGSTQYRVLSFQSNVVLMIPHFGLQISEWIIHRGVSWCQHSCYEDCSIWGEESPLLEYFELMKFTDAFFIFFLRDGSILDLVLKLFMSQIWYGRKYWCDFISVNILKKQNHKYKFISL